MVETIYILLGSNLGNSIENLIQAKEYIAEVAQITRFSSVYSTKAWGNIIQDDFLNQAIQLESNGEPDALLKKFKSIEIKMGRVETVKWGPRVIDIDILFFGNQVIQSDDLKIPHPHIPDRRFTLMPLCEIAPDLIHPVLNQSIQQLLLKCQDNLTVTKISFK